MYGKFTDEFLIQYLKRKLLAAGLTQLQAAELAPIIKPELEEKHQPIILVPDDVRPTLKGLHAKGYKMGSGQQSFGSN